MEEQWVSWNCSTALLASQYLVAYKPGYVSKEGGQAIRIQRPLAILKVGALSGPDPFAPGKRVDEHTPRGRRATAPASRPIVLAQHALANTRSSGYQAILFINISILINNLHS